MSFIVDTNEPKTDLAGLEEKEYDYQYPFGLDLRPNSELHNMIANTIRMNARQSRVIVEKRFDSWNLMDEKLTAYTPTTQKEQDVKAEDRRKPISIVVPYSYAILETMLSYLIAAFLPEPIFRYEGASPEDIVGAILMEKKIALDCNRSKVALALHTMFRDALAYGLGIVTPTWDVRRGKRVTRQEGGFINFFQKFIGTGPERSVEDAILFEGNKLTNIDPYRYFPDPNVPVHEPQRGEFAGWLDESNLFDMMDEELANPDYFNVRYLQHVQNKRSIYAIDQSRRMEKVGGSYKEQSAIIAKPVDMINMYIKLIPRKWKIGTSDYPEKWLFTVAADDIVIRAKPLGLNHNMFPITVCAPDFDGYSPIAISRLEIVQGMQETLDWLFNSHIANVRKAINDMIIVDPYLVNINDMKDPKPGKLIRLRRPAWGRGVDKVAQQLQVTDITKSNIQDAMFIMQYMQQIVGTDNPMMGSLRKGGPERLSAREFQGTAQGAISRLERIAKVIGLQAMQDIGYMFAHHTQQLMTQDVYVKSVGKYAEDIVKEMNPKRDRVKVTPWDVLVEYDLLVRDGSVPGGNYSQNWIQLFQTIMSSEQLAGRFDIMNIFKYIARNMGAKNVDEFEIDQPVQAQVRPDEEVGAQAAAGNVIPFGA